MPTPRGAERGIEQARDQLLSDRKARGCTRAPGNDRQTHRDLRRVDVCMRERVRRRGVMMTVADDEAAVGTLHDDQVDAVLQVFRLFGRKARFERHRGVKISITPVASKAQVRHERAGHLEAGIGQSAQWMPGMSIARTVVLRMNVTPRASESHAARRGIASRDSTRSSFVLLRTASSAGTDDGEIKSVRHGAWRHEITHLCNPHFSVRKPI